MVITLCDFLDADCKCTRQYAMIIGHCKYCVKKFCAKHRLPESHSCTNIDACKKEQFERNKKTLLGNTCVGSKLENV